MHHGTGTDTREANAGVGLGERWGEHAGESLGARAPAASEGAASSVLSAFWSFWLAWLPMLNRAFRAFARCLLRFFGRRILQNALLQ